MLIGDAIALLLQNTLASDAARTSGDRAADTKDKAIELRFADLVAGDREPQHSGTDVLEARQDSPAAGVGEPESPRMPKEDSPAGKVLENDRTDRVEADESLLNRESIAKTPHRTAEARAAKKMSADAPIAEYERTRLPSAGTVELYGFYSDAIHRLSYDVADNYARSRHFDATTPVSSIHLQVSVSDTVLPLNTVVQLGQPSTTIPGFPAGASGAATSQDSSVRQASAESRGAFATFLPERYAQRNLTIVGRGSDVRVYFRDFRLSGRMLAAVVNKLFSASDISNDIVSVTVNGDTKYQKNNKQGI